MEDEKREVDRKRRKLADIAVAKAKEEKKEDKLKGKEKSLRTLEMTQKEEIQAAEALIVGGSKRLANAIAKHDFEEASVAQLRLMVQER